MTTYFNDYFDDEHCHLKIRKRSTALLPNWCDEQKCFIALVPGYCFWGRNWSHETFYHFPSFTFYKKHQTLFFFKFVVVVVFVWRKEASDREKSNLNLSCRHHHRRRCRRHHLCASNDLERINATLNAGWEQINTVNARRRLTESRSLIVYLN